MTLFSLFILTTALSPEATALIHTGQAAEAAGRRSQACAAYQQAIAADDTLASDRSMQAKIARACAPGEDAPPAPGEEEIAAEEPFKRPVRLYMGIGFALSSIWRGAGTGIYDGWCGEPTCRSLHVVERRSLRAKTGIDLQYAMVDVGIRFRDRYRLNLAFAPLSFANFESANDAVPDISLRFGYDIASIVRRNGEITPTIWLGGGYAVIGGNFGPALSAAFSVDFRFFWIYIRPEVVARYQVTMREESWQLGEGYVVDYSRPPSTFDLQGKLSVGAAF